MSNIYLNVDLIGGFCNKFFCLFSAIKLCLDKKYILIEPYFGRRIKSTLFGNIYDISYFNDIMKKYYGRDLMISIESLNNIKNKTIINNNINLWIYSTTLVTEQRKDKNKICKLNPKDTLTITLKSLKLIPCYLEIVNQYLDYMKEATAIHTRIESDWLAYSKVKKVLTKENLYTDIDNIIKLYKTKKFTKNVFITTASTHDEIVKLFNLHNYECKYYFNNDIEVEICSAINFDICSNAKYFIGITRSTYSNLISFNRCLSNKNVNYIYNYNNTIYRRIDKGIQCDPERAIAITTQI